MSLPPPTPKSETTYTPPIVDDGIGQKDDTSQGDQTTATDHSANAAPYPEPQSAVGAFVNDEGIDLNTEADHTPTAQGNKYGVQKDAAENYARDAEARIRDLEKQLVEAKADRDKWREAAGMPSLTKSTDTDED